MARPRGIKQIVPSTLPKGSRGLRGGQPDRGLRDVKRVTLPKEPLFTKSAPPVPAPVALGGGKKKGAF